ncbi:VPLPA-CTERM sorting domain-containing protein [Paracoccaceae bacterium GXU_MW_L88]
MRLILTLVALVVSAVTVQAATQYYSVTGEGECGYRLEVDDWIDLGKSGRCAINYRFAIDESDFGKRLPLLAEDMDRNAPTWQQDFVLSAYVEGQVQRRYGTSYRFEQERCVFYECAIAETTSAGVLTHLDVSNFERSCLTGTGISLTPERGFAGSPGLCFDGVGSPNRTLGGGEILRIVDVAYDYWAIEMDDRRILYNPPFATPLPASAFLLIAGVAGLGFTARKRR